MIPEPTVIVRMGEGNNSIDSHRDDSSSQLFLHDIYINRVNNTMFTGLVDHVGHIEKMLTLPLGVELHIQTQFTDLINGESIAVDGACLTVTKSYQNSFVVQLSHETLERTIAKHYDHGTAVNLERSLKLEDRLGGHFVSGHVDQTAKITDIIPHNEFIHFIINDIAEEQQNYLIYKGSITLNGVSLTINKIEASFCHLLLIPHTLQRTNLSTLTIGDPVNIEFDLLAKLVARQLQGAHHEKNI